METADNGKLSQCREIELPELLALDFSSVPEDTLYYYRDYCFPYCAIYRDAEQLKIEFQQHILAKCWPMAAETAEERLMDVSPNQLADLMVIAIGELRAEGMPLADELYAYYFVTWTLTESAHIRGEQLFKKLETCNYAILKRALAINQNTPPK